MNKLLSPGKTNAKTKKNLRPTKILYLHPSVVDGKDMCPHATTGCRASCLNTAGLGGVYPSIQKSRLERTKFYVQNRVQFYDRVQTEINKFAATHSSESVAIRLNGTSDQPLVETLLVAQMRHIEPNVIFYDYTKNHKKAGVRILPSGHMYVVAFSYSEHEDSEARAKNILSNGGVVAVVFDKVPTTLWGYPVIDGDERDDVMIDHHDGVILGLKAKGKAKYDDSGFVIKSKQLELV